GCHSLDKRAKRPNAEMFADSPMAKAGVQCIDCHMSRIGYRSDRTAKYSHPWDVSNHTFMVSLPIQETVEGIRSSCSGCHEGGRKGLAEVARLLNETQQQTRASIGQVQRILGDVKSKGPKAVSLTNEAGAKLEIILLDGSMGFHN